MPLKKGHFLFLTGLSDLLFSPSLKNKVCCIQHFNHMDVGHHDISFRETFIKSEETYRIPVETLFKICEARKISLSDFFKLINE